MIGMVAIVEALAGPRYHRRATGAPGGFAYRTRRQPRFGSRTAFTHLTERTARAADLNTSLCAVLLAEACNTGLEPLVHNDFSALRRDRLSWVNQNYIREETLLAANAKLVSAQNQIALARAWGGGEVASADGICFVVPIAMVHAATTARYLRIATNKVCSTVSSLDLLPHPVAAEAKPASPQYF
jgi:hypothetical protein